MGVVNWDVIRQPYNWATVIIITLFGLILLAIVSPQPSASS